MILTYSEQSLNVTIMNLQEKSSIFLTERFKEY